MTETLRYKIFLQQKTLRRVALATSFVQFFILLGFWVVLRCWQHPESAKYWIPGALLLLLFLLMAFYPKIRYRKTPKSLALTPQHKTSISLYRAHAFKIPALMPFFLFQIVLIVLDILFFGGFLSLGNLSFQIFWNVVGIALVIRYLFLIILDLGFLVYYYRAHPRDTLYTPLLLRS